MSVLHGVDTGEQLSLTVVEPSPLRTMPLSAVSGIHPRLNVDIVRRAIRAGRLPATRVGHQFFINEEEVREVLIKDYE